MNIVIFFIVLDFWFNTNKTTSISQLLTASFVGIGGWRGVNNAVRSVFTLSFSIIALTKQQLDQLENLSDIISDTFIFQENINKPRFKT